MKYCFVGVGGGWGQDIPPETNNKCYKNKNKHLRLCRTAGIHPGVQPPVREVIPHPFVYSPGAEANGLEPNAKVREESSGSMPGRARQIHINVTIAGHGPRRQG